MNQEKIFLILRVMFNKFYTGQTNVMAALPESIREGVTAQNIAVDELRDLIMGPLDILSKIHYSWLVAKFNVLSRVEQTFFLSTAPRELLDKLVGVLKIKIPSLKVTDAFKDFLLLSCLRKIGLDSVLPLKYLPKTEMREVAYLDKKEILKLIDFLGVYDLAEEIRHIVDRKILENIYRCLSVEKHAFLRECLHRKEKLVSQRLKLEMWDGNSLKLARLLHHRGIVRLGYALSGEEKEIIWYVTHTLDTGRGKKLSCYICGERITGVTSVLRQQVLKVIDFIR